MLFPTVIYFSLFNFLIVRYTIFLTFVYFIITMLCWFLFLFGSNIYQSDYSSSRIYVDICNCVSDRYFFRGSNFSIRVNQTNKRLFFRDSCYTWGTCFSILFSTVLLFSVEVVLIDVGIDFWIIGIQNGVSLILFSKSITLVFWID